MCENAAAPARRFPQVKVDTLSSHFVARWTERIGVEPTLETVLAVIDQGTVIRRQKRLYRRRQDGEYRPVQLLTEVWCPRVSLIIRVDESSRTAVTVITPN